MSPNNPHPARRDVNALMAGRTVRYKGWTVTYRDCRPVTGKFRAEKYGVWMCAGTADLLFHMIDRRHAEALGESLSTTD